MSLSQLSKLLPLPSEDLQQILDYAVTLSSDEAADHFYDLLGHSAETTKFIQDFNKTGHGGNDKQNDTSSSAVSKKHDASNSLTAKKRGQKKKKKDFLPTRETRQVLDDVTHDGIRCYKKQDEENYMGAMKKVVAVDNKQSHNPTLLSKAPPQQRVPSPLVTPGTLISDSTFKQGDKASHFPKASGLGSSSKSKSKTKISISGGKALHGESTIISELDAAIRALEISTNSKLNSQDPSRRACNCIGTRHPILTAAPNCLSCGKVICVIEGLGPCTFCETPLLSSVEVQTMISHLREERGREKMIADNMGRKRAEVASTPKPFSTPREHSSSLHIGESQISSAKIQAQAHRDKLLGFQAQNAKRTTVRDEVADFNIDESEVKRDMLWATPIERANALKKQQKLRQEMEWQAKPEYEKRQVVLSLDVVKGKVIKQIRNSVREQEDRVEDEPRLNVNTVKTEEEISDQKISHNFRNNPLIGNLIRPIWSAQVSPKTEMSTGEGEKESKWKLNTWRRVLDDQDDNEVVILDGGLSGEQ
ncbi:hypothetical protein EPUL_003077 [Erysiphe pulchra]|uniref:TRIP4/RQT4 C2HC5-type zinc finger domain-containing protein n=1 Tax=Erysiphe pulchra TaxID=225359 RepID=A0A2S4PY10_9PEZI|nr:hypothetical protein EPUL_003077 [Erysiphe pulchra]